VTLIGRSQFPNESEEFDNSTLYGNSAKRYRPFYESVNDGQRDENFEVYFIYRFF
jgi:hypothetical protein